ncbi:TasA family protein [Sporosarcina sp. 6E9]|uniref:TasA family protein n=1 Tax=Sporosarcina sp. 6E9 TaxID=2819235 RepID=UPI001B314BDC|nr:TasA family protein [Sporosarcina sp. 6E9]
MSLKKKLAMSIATGALAVSMIGGGTYAYFNDVEVNQSTFAAGTLDINIEGNDADNAIINVDNLKPGDYMIRTFKINNTGSLDVSKVLLTSNYTVSDYHNDNKATDDFGEHIKVKFLVNADKRSPVLWETTLKNLSEADAVERDIIGTILGGEPSGLKAGTSDELIVMFEFVDAGDQNVFQGDSLKLNWTFDAKQTSGTLR